MSTKYFCAQCNKKLNEPLNTPKERRQPCPNCGSTRRLFVVHISQTMHTYSSIRTKHKEVGIKKPISETFTGSEQHRKTGKWFKKERLIDRKNNKYKELITDPENGKIIHHIEEPLDKHTGHGSAKQQKL